MDRRRESGAEELVTLVARTPWWVGVILAIAAYLGLSVLATVKGGPALALMLRSAGDSAPTAGTAKAEHGDGPEMAQPPACPTCSKPMIRRVAKQGARSGEAFWGCTGFPSCRGIRPLS